MALIKLDIKHSKSFKIYPRNKRKPFSKILSSSEELSRKALNASEKELKHVITVANMRGEKMEAIIHSDVENGFHLINELFIPEYLGFEFTVEELKDCSSAHIYSKEGYNISRLDGDLYLVLCPNKEKPVLRIRNMFEAIMILGSLGMDLNVKTFMEGAYTKEKNLDEIVEDVIEKVIEDRTKKTEDA